jgi:hypothetical protein
MKCLRCQHENRPTAKFCEECAAPLVRTCSKCGVQLSPTAKFCFGVRASRRPTGVLDRITVPRRRGLHPAAPRREDPDLKGRPRGHSWR